MNSTIVNIAPENIYEKCTKKCAYAFNYSDSNCYIVNKGNNITILYDPTPSPPVMYNGNQYIVNELQLVRPSSQQFNGNTTDAELIVVHTPVSVGNLLYVCLPIVSVSDSSNSITLLDEVVQGAAAGAPSTGESTNIPIQNFNLNTILPKKSFYSYTIDKYDYIVFEKGNATTLKQKNIDILNKILSVNPPQTMDMDKTLLFYNNKGATSLNKSSNGNVNDNEIYIDCKPTGTSDDTIDVVKNTPASVNDLFSFSDLSNNKTFSFTFKIIMLSLLLFVFLLLFYFIFKIIGSTKTKTENG